MVTRAFFMPDRDQFVAPALAPVRVQMHVARAGRRPKLVEPTTTQSDTVVARNNDHTLTLSRLPEGPYLGLAAFTHSSHAGIATGTAVVVDPSGTMASATATALADAGFARRAPSSADEETAR